MGVVPTPPATHKEPLYATVFQPLLAGIVVARVQLIPLELSAIVSPTATQMAPFQATDVHLLENRAFPDALGVQVPDGSEL